MNDGFASVELFHDRPELRVAQPDVFVAREQADAVRFQRVAGVLDFFQRGIHVGQRHRREESEPGRVILHQLRAVLVARAGEPVRHGPVSEPQARIRDRHDRGGNAAPVHVLDRLRGRPSGVGGVQQRPPLDLRDPGGRREMVVDVDAVGPRGSCRLEGRQSLAADRRRQAQRSDGADQEVSTSKVGHDSPPQHANGKRSYPRACFRT